MTPRISRFGALLARGLVILGVVACSRVTLRYGTVGQAPLTLVYADNPAVYHRQIAIAVNVPTVTGGTPNQYAVTPALPAGLVLDTATGTISGIPSVIAPPQTYAVTATNALGSASASLLLTVTDTPPALAFQSDYVFVVGHNTVTAVPVNTGGPIASCAVSPALPTGLSVNGTTCAIGGTPTTPEGDAPYTLSVSYDGGSVDVVVSLSVVASLSLFPPTVTLRALPSAPFALTTLGGVAPFTYSSTGPGSIDGSGVYTPAALVRSTAVVQVTDAIGETATANIATMVTLVDGQVHAFASDADSYYLGGDFSFANPFPSPYLVSADLTTGAPLPAFDTQQSFDGGITGIASDDAWLYVIGAFKNYRGAPAYGIAKLSLDTGEVDPSFTSGAGFSGQSPLAIVADANSLYIGGSISTYDGTTTTGLVKLSKKDASLETSFVPAFIGHADRLALAGAVLYAGYSGSSTVLAALDSVTGHTVSDFSAPTVSAGVVFNAITVNADGIFVALDTNSTTHQLWKLNPASGLQQSGFPLSFDASASALVAGTDRIYVAGQFSKVGTTTIGHLAAVASTTGAIVTSLSSGDISAEPGPNLMISSLALSGSTLYAAGWFSHIGSSVATSLAALDADSLTPVPGFDQGGLAADEQTVVATSANALYVGGSFTGYGGVRSPHLAKIAADTLTADVDFASQGGTDGQVSSLALDAEPALYVGGQFLHYGGTCSPGLIKLATTGASAAWDVSLKTTAAVCTSRGTVASVAVYLSKGKATTIIGGAFNGVWAAGSDYPSITNLAMFYFDGTPVSAQPNPAAVVGVGLYGTNAYYATASAISLVSFAGLSGSEPTLSASNLTAFAVQPGESGVMYFTTYQVLGSATLYVTDATLGSASTVLTANGIIESLAPFTGSDSQYDVYVAGNFNDFDFGSSQASDGLLLVHGAELGNIASLQWGATATASSTDIAVVSQANGLVFIGGKFTQYQGHTAYFAAFVNPSDGSFAR